MNILLATFKVIHAVFEKIQTTATNLPISENLATSEAQLSKGALFEKFGKKIL